MPCNGTPIGSRPESVLNVITKVVPLMYTLDTIPSLTNGLASMLASTFSFVFGLPLAKNLIVLLDELYSTSPKTLSNFVSISLNFVVTMLLEIGCGELMLNSWSTTPLPFNIVKVRVLPSVRTKVM